MTPLFLVLQEIRDLGSVRPADLLKRTKMDSPALFKVLGELTKRGLIAIDAKTGTLSPTTATRADLRHSQPPANTDDLVARLRDAVSTGKIARKGPMQGGGAVPPTVPVGDA